MRYIYYACVCANVCVRVCVCLTVKSYISEFSLTLPVAFPFNEISSANGGIHLFGHTHTHTRAEAFRV